MQRWQRRDPEQSALYALVQEHLETFLAHRGASFAGTRYRAPLPQHVVRELEGFLDCGLLCRGFIRVHCDGCSRDGLVAFSCKGRGFCPSCGGRRMADTAAHLVDHVLPDVPVRQWVLSLPQQIRFLIARRPELCCVVRGIFIRAVQSFYKRRATGSSQGEPARWLGTGAVVVVQRFDSALRLDPHFHALLLDGVYTDIEPALAVSNPSRVPQFHPAPPPSEADLAWLCRHIAVLVTGHLRRAGYVDDHGRVDQETLELVEAEDDALAKLQAVAIHGKIAAGRRRGQEVGLWDQLLDDGTRRARPHKKHCADHAGFSLHAGVRVPAHQRQRLERLCRSIGLIGGSPKCCKTWFGLDMAVSVATGTDALGHFPTSGQGPALVYLAEDALPQVRCRIEAICRRRNHDIDRLDLHVITAPTLRLDQKADQDRLAETIGALGPQLVLLDPLVRLHRLDENSAGEISGLLSFFRDLQRRFDAAIVLVHHASKKQRSQPGQALRGSSDLHAIGDCNAYLARKDQRIMLTIEHRAARSPEPMLLELLSDEAGDAIALQVCAQHGAPAGEREASLEHRVLDSLNHANAPLTRYALRAKLRVNNQKLGEVLASLDERSLITRVEGGWRTPV